MPTDRQLPVNRLSGSDGWQRRRAIARLLACARL